MTLILTTDTEARILTLAKMSGQDPEETLVSLLNQALTKAEADFAPIVMSAEETQQVIAALRKSDEDIAAGRWISLEDYETQIKEQRRTRLSQNVTA